MINGTNLLGKDNPRWLIGNAAETIRALDAVLPAQRGPAAVPPGPGVRRTSVTGRPVRAVADALSTAGGITLAWLIGLPRRLGNRLFTMNDAEAGWRGWQVTELSGGLGRQYRDARFEMPQAHLGPSDGQT